MVICCFFKHRIRTWSLFSEPLSLQFLQFKEKLQSRTEPSLACWSIQIRVTPFFECGVEKTVTSKSSQLFSPSSLAVSSACYSLSVPLLLLNVSESLHPGLPALLNNWPGQLAVTAACHLIFGLCPSGQDFSMALSFWKPAFLFLNQSLCHHSEKSTLKPKSRVLYDYFLTLEPFSLCWASVVLALCFL